MTNSETEEKWYNNKGYTIALLVILFPAGLYALWKGDVFSSKVKYVVTGFFALVILAGPLHVAMMTPEERATFYAELEQKKQERKVAAAKRKLQREKKRAAQILAAKQEKSRSNAIKHIERAIIPGFTQRTIRELTEIFDSGQWKDITTTAQKKNKATEHLYYGKVSVRNKFGENRILHLKIIALTYSNGKIVFVIRYKDPRKQFAFKYHSLTTILKIVHGRKSSLAMGSKAKKGLKKLISFLDQLKKTKVSAY